MQRQFKRSLESLESIYAFTEDALEHGAIDAEKRFPVHLAIEELFVNMVHYYPDNDNDVRIEVSTDDGEVSVTMIDEDVDAFDVSAPVAVDTDAPLDERRPGGLGLHLIQRMVDSLDYTWNDRQSTIKFTKK